MTALKSLILAGVTLAISAGVAPCAQAQIGAAELPPEVTGFIGRRASCQELSQKAFDPDAQINSIMSNMRSLQCGDIADDERALRLKYANNSEILASLKTNWVKVVKRLPVRIVVPPALDR